MLNLSQPCYYRLSLIQLWNHCLNRRNFVMLQGVDIIRSNAGMDFRIYVVYSSEPGTG